MKYELGFSDLGLASFVAGKVVREGDHVRLVRTPKDSKRLTKESVSFSSGKEDWV